MTEGAVGGAGIGSWRQKVPTVPPHVTAAMERVGRGCLGVRRDVEDEHSKCEISCLKVAPNFYKDTSP